MTETIDTAALEAFLAEPRNAIVAGIRRDGRPHLTPNWFLWDGERFFISTTKDRVKYRVFSNDPRTQLAIDDVFGFRYVIVEGTVEVSDDLDNGIEYFRALRHKHGRHEQTDDELRAEMVRDSRVLLVITPDGPPETWSSRGF